MQTRWPNSFAARIAGKKTLWNWTLFQPLPGALLAGKPTAVELDSRDASVSSV